MTDKVKPTDTKADAPAAPAASQPDALYQSVFSKVHEANHYQAKEGPQQALQRLQDQGYLSELSIGNIHKAARDKVKKELGHNGELHRNYYTTKDQVLSPEQEKKQVDGLVERIKKDQQAERLAATSEQIKQAMTPEVAAKMQAAGLETDPDKLRTKLINQLNQDAGMTSDSMAKMKGEPVGTPYVATGAVSEQELTSVLAKQKSMRDDAMKHPEFKDLSKQDLWKNKDWLTLVKSTDVGTLLRADAANDPAALAKIDAADALITNLQKAQKGN
jgi:hypothetical protein